MSWLERTNSSALTNRHKDRLLAIKWGSFCTSLMICVAAAQAQTPAEFFRGKTVKIIVAAAPGAAYDFVGRALAAHLGQYIPGSPSIVVENMPGAGSLVAVNTLYNRAPRDGTVMGLPINGIVLEPRLKLLSREGGATNFDVRKMIFVGSPTQQPQILWVWHKSAFTGIDDLRNQKAIVGATSFGGDNYILPVMSNALLGTKFNVVTGYKAVNDVFLAGERGELDGGTVNYSSIAGKSDWMRDKKARILIQFGADRIAELPDVPTAIELATDENIKQALRTYSVKFKAAYPFMLPPEVPKDRVEALRAAFMETMKDKQFIEDSRRIGVEVDPVSGQAIADLVTEVDKVPQNVIDLLAKTLN
ncbi:MULTISPECIES: tripartite tricarboxylate transporter substrate-binding protein [unclassified Beijerinckia]|uniref:Bug family tripartite tricarboxylate transporter substrate binding protein n=1 Tax=unclassified Beijerinckia TaxID=2638183 RepID=UPI00147C3D92|nr:MULTISPECIES: tripartite tricarboxylate transporter substrate-binding protein [unclassified Beijerinckia]